MTMEELLEAYAVALKSYHANEDRFMDAPTLANLVRFHIALDHLVLLRDEVSRANKLSDAMNAAQMAPVIDDIIEKLAASSD